MISKNSLIRSASVAAVALAFAVPAFAQTTTPSTASHTGKSTAEMTARVACVGRAVIIRESSLVDAMTKFTGVENGAYAARSNALSNAYSLSTPAAVKAAVKTAWSTFTTTTKNARSQWTTSRTGAWSTFKTSALACKAPAGVTDTSHSYSDVSGN